MRDRYFNSNRSDKKEREASLNRKWNDNCTDHNIYGQCARMKRTNEEATLNNCKRDVTVWKRVEQEIIKLVRGLQNIKDVVWSVRFITFAPSSVALIRDDLIKN